MCCNFPLCWAKTAFSLTEPAQKLVTRWLSMRKIWLLAGWVYTKIISAHHMHFQSFSSVPPVTRSSVPFSRSYQTSYVLCLTSLPWLPTYVPCLTSLPCFPTYVPCLTSLLLTSRPLSPVLRLCSLSHILCPLSHVFCSLPHVRCSQS
jgi:hypothetical protein